MAQAGPKGHFGHPPSDTEDDHQNKAHHARHDNRTKEMIMHENTPWVVKGADAVP